MSEKTLKQLNFPQYRFRGALIGKIANGKKSAYIRVHDPGYWDVSKGDHRVAMNDAAKLHKLKSTDDIISYVLFLLI
jgi:hypothetical protein